MPKPGDDPSSGISLGDALRLPKRHPAWRRREAQPGSCTERENLDGDGKGKAQAAPTARPKAPMRRLGADCSVVALKRGNARGAKGAGAGQVLTFRTKSQIELRAAYMPAPAWAVSGHPPN